MLSAWSWRRRASNLGQCGSTVGAAQGLGQGGLPCWQAVSGADPWCWWGRVEGALAAPGSPAWLCEQVSLVMGSCEPLIATSGPHSRAWARAASVGRCACVVSPAACFLPNKRLSSTLSMRVATWGLLQVRRQNNRVHQKCTLTIGSWKLGSI